MKMKNFKLLLMLFSIASSIGCNAQEKKTIKTEYKIDFNNKLELIKIDSINFSATYFNTHKLDSFVYSFDKKKQQICIYTEDIKQLLNCIDLKFNNYVVSIYPLNQDSIYCLLDKEILLLSKEFKIITKYKLKRKKSIFYTAIDNFQFYIEKNKCYIQKYNVDCFDYQNDCYNENIESVIDLESKTIDEIDVNYSDVFKNKDFTANLRGIQRVVNNGSHTYNFSVDSNIYVYNKKTKKTKKISAKAQYQADIPAFSNKIIKNVEKKSQKIYDYFYTVPQYVYLNYDYYRKYYYRIYFHGQELKNSEGFYNEYLDRQTILLIFDENFIKLAEIEIDTKKYNYGIIPLIDGIAIPRRKFIDNKPQYDIYNFKNI